MGDFHTQPDSREALEAEIGMLREKLSDALAGGLPHRSDCAVYQAPAYEPGPCNCGIGATVDDNAYDLVKKIRSHNGWTYDESNAVNLVKSFLATSSVSLEDRS